MAAMVAPSETASRTLRSSQQARAPSGDAATPRQAPKVVFVFLKPHRLPRLRGCARPGRLAAAAHTHASRPRGPRETARTQSTRAGARRRDSENLAAAARRPELARARGHVAAAVRATHQKHITQKIAPMRPTHAATQNRNRAGPRPCNGTSPASPRTTTTSTSSSATARRRSCATTRSLPELKSYATASTANTSSRTSVTQRGSFNGLPYAIDARRLHQTRSGLVSFLILRLFGPHREASRTRVAGPHPEGHPGRLRRRHDPRARRARRPDGGLHGYPAPRLFSVGRAHLGADSVS